MITFKAKAPDGEIINSALEPFFFPAGEAHTKIKEHRELEKIEIAIIQPSAESLHNDLFALAMWSDYLSRQASPIHTVAVIPYFPGARQDRGEPYGLGVYSEFFSTLAIDQLIVFDPHSPQTLLRNSFNEVRTTAVYSDELISSPSIKPFFGKYTGIIAPDAGATIRAGAVAVNLGIRLYTASKKRNPDTGHLSNFEIEALPKDGKYLIIDDICDGGGTFIGLAKASGLPKENLDLWVSHGVFSKMATFYLPEHFETIYTTNSYNPTRPLNPDPETSDEHPFVRVDVIRQLLKHIDVCHECS